MNRLMLHAGATIVERDALDAIEVPPGTDTWYPIEHVALLERVEAHVEASGWRIQSREFALYNGGWPGDADPRAKHEGVRFFALMLLQMAQADHEIVADHPDYQLAIGLRNSHDQSFAASLAIGSRVFVCDNLAFSADILLSRKHTKNALSDLDRLVAEAAGRISSLRVTQDQRIAAYKGLDLDDRQAHDFIIRSVDAGVMANQRIPDLLANWRAPAHAEFEPRTGWSLFNAFTTVAKRFSPVDIVQRTTRLHGLLDSVAGLIVAPSEN